MQNFIATLLICSVTMSALALLYMAVTPFFATRYSEKGLYYAWLIIVIGLIIPFRPSWTSTIFTIDVPMANTTNDFVNTTAQAWSVRVATMPTPTTNAITTPILATFDIISWHWVAAAWLIGAVVFIAVQAIRHHRFVKAAKRWSEAITNEQILSLFYGLKTELGIKKQLGLYLSPCVGSPMMIGFINPQILLPTQELTEDELHFILKHELVHYKRKDLLYKSLILLATAIHWFNPVVYLMARVLSTLCETSCDAEVVQGTNEDTRQKYCETIIGVVKYRSKMKLSTALSTNFYGGKKGMKNRISSIMDMTKKKVGALMLCGVLALTLGTSMVVAANASSPINDGQHGMVRFFNLGEVSFVSPDANVERIMSTERIELIRINSEISDAVNLDELSELLDAKEGFGEVLIFNGVTPSVRTFRLGDSYELMSDLGQSPIVDENGEVLMWVPQFFFEMTYEEFNEFAELLDTLVMLPSQTAWDINILREHLF